MKDFNIGEIIGLLLRTEPFLVFRFLIYFGITLGYVLVTGAGAGMGYGIGAIAGDSAVGGTYGGIAGFAVAGALMYFLREYLLYMVKAGHIAVLVELLEGRELPGGRSQIDHAQQVVRERFVQSSVLFGLDQLIKGILKSFNRIFFTVANLLPIPGAGGLVKFLNTVLNLSLTYLDEVILAYNIHTRAENPWDGSKTALMQVFFKVTQGQQANPEWEAKLDSASGKFRELKDKAANWHKPDTPAPENTEA